MSRTCIICKKPKNENDFNEEHVFPDSIGGEYKIHNVCADCNSHLGKNIDSKFIESGLIRHYNHKLKIENKNGNVVPIIQGSLVNPKDHSIKLNTIWDNKGNLKNTEFETTVNGNVVSYDESKPLNTILLELDILFKKDKIPCCKDIEDKEEKKDRFNEFKENFKTQYIKNEYHSSKDPIEKTLITNEQEIVLEAMKISYELTHEILGENYFNDTLCETFRKYLIKGRMDEEFHNKIKYEISYEEIENPINLHYFILFKLDNTLFTTVNLYNTILIGFMVSENASQYDLKEKNCIIFSHEGIAYKKS